MDAQAIGEWICARMDALEEAAGYCLVSCAHKVGSPQDLSSLLLDEFGIAHLDFPLFGEQPHFGGKMKAAFSYKELKAYMRPRRIWSCPNVVFVGIGETASRVFAQLTGLAIDKELRCAHYCMWHRLDVASDAWRKVEQVLSALVGPSNFRERVGRAARRHARKRVSEKFKFYFRAHARTADHVRNHRAAICDPSASTRSAQSSNMKSLRSERSFEEKRSLAVKESAALSASSAKRMRETHREQREAQGRRKFHATDSGNVEATEASRCPWCEDDTLCAEGVYKNGRLLCATCGLSCYIKEDRSGLERRATQQRVLLQLRKKREQATAGKKSYLDRALSRFES